MATNPLAINLARFILLLFAQVLIFNDLGFMGFINPIICVLFVYWYPIEENRILFLLTSFFLGFMVDLFSDTMALHSIALLTIAFIRPFLMRFCFGANFEYQGFGFRNTTRIQRYTLLALMVFIHHFIFFFLEILSFSHFLLILKKFVFIGLATFILGLLINSLFAKSK